MAERLKKLWSNKHFRMLVLFLAIYSFLLSIEFIGAGFKGLGGDTSESLMKTIDDPLSAFFVGLLATALVQSSSLTTSLLVMMTATGLIPVETAIPAVMGANIGTTITNTLVSFGHITRKQEFSRAFSGAVVHDFFNIFAVIIILPIELVFHPILRISKKMTEAFVGVGGGKVASPVKEITKPVSEAAHDVLASAVSNPEVVMIAIGIALLFLALKFLVSSTQYFVVGKGEKLINEYLFRGPMISFFLGMALTGIIQSSSITTSIIIPLVGAGILTVEKIFPYTLGANVGTTITAILAALALGEAAGINIAFAHLTFNLMGIAIIYPHPKIRQIPINAAKRLGNYISKEGRRGKNLAIVMYILVIFYVIPFIYIILSRRFH